jgi:hypothetical protein
MKWKKRKGKHIATSPSLPGVWAVKEGGWLVRGRCLNPKTGRQVEVRRILDLPTAPDALKWLRDRQEAIRSGGTLAPLARPRFSEYATSLFAAKVEAQEIQSAAGRQKWSDALTGHLIPDLGDLWVDMIEHRDLEAWRLAAARRVKQGKLKPRTFNTHLSILRVIMKAATADLSLRGNPCSAIKPLPVGRTHTIESPNSLEPDQVPAFLAKMYEHYPQLYAMTLLGFTTGLRPSHMRPLRRQGPHADIDWDRGYLYVRRSHTLKSEIMDATKTKLDQRIALPSQLVAELRAHVDRLKPKQKESDLLFPSVRGGLRARSLFDKPFEDIRKQLGIPHKLTAKGMRRTYQDLARETQIRDIVTRSISGHTTVAMQEHYSTVSEDEQRDALATIIDFAAAKRASGA